MELNTVFNNILYAFFYWLAFFLLGKYFLISETYKASAYAAFRMLFFCMAVYLLFKALKSEGWPQDFLVRAIILMPILLSVSHNLAIWFGNDLPSIHVLKQTSSERTLIVRLFFYVFFYILFYFWIMFGRSGNSHDPPKVYKS
jgi:hypothetical protein